MRLALMIAALAALTACGTIEGMGQDISGASRRVQSWL